MEKRLKALAKCPHRVKSKFSEALPMVQQGRFQHLDIQPVVNKPGFRRRRIGDYRVLLQQQGDRYIVVSF